MTAQKQLVEGHTKLWVRVSEGSDVASVWRLGTLIKQLPRGKGVIVRTRGGTTASMTQVYLTNPKVERDMTSLWHIHEPGILHNLEQRSLSDEPYTFMGPVLVAVNPLRDTKPPKNALGKPGASTKAHPYAVAEVAYQQMIFGNANQKRLAAAAAASSKKAKKDKKKASSASPPPAPETSEVVNQSVVVSGESGAGKTESSKMVLAHLVARCGGGSLDKKLLCSNPILESFGNATTLRNHNSSRFGKFLKLHFSGNAKSIDSASVETYLLELSRITHFEVGERNYHIFYELLAGTPKAKLKEYGFDRKSKMRYLKFKDGASSKLQLKTRDKVNFEGLVKAFKDMSIAEEEMESVFRFVAGVIHLGDISFVDQEKSAGQVATVPKDSQGALKSCASMLGMTSKDLSPLFSERKVTVRGESLTTFRTAHMAEETRDSLATALYSRLFLWVVDRISMSLKKKKKKKSPKSKEDDKDLFIGVLDIFGFESFMRNDFEQLLINFTNESLQATFNHQVFQAELELFRREGLSVAAEEGTAGSLPSNQEGMELFLGEPGSGGFGSGKVPGLLTLIVQEGQAMNATDVKMVKRMHETFQGKNGRFMKVHPKDREHQFTIGHYAGDVTYTVGNFLRKNRDQLPDDVHEVVGKTSSTFVLDVWSKGPAAPVAVQGKARKQQSIISKFKSQISGLMETIEATRCSFIRCVKPNPLMKRTGKSTSWFDHRYVANQLHCLSIPQTALVLKSGYPTRVPYLALTDTYKSVLPKSCIKTWKSLGGGNEQAFVAALFWAFKIPRENYKLGLTKVFFRSGMLSSLDSVLQAASDWSSAEKVKSRHSKKEVSKRFRQFHARRRWRVAAAKVMAVNAFIKLQNGLHASATKIQSAWRSFVARQQRKDLMWAVVMIQVGWRGYCARKEFNDLMAEKMDKIKRELEMIKKMANEKQSGKVEEEEEKGVESELEEEPKKKPSKKKKTKKGGKKKKSKKGGKKGEVEVEEEEEEEEEETPTESKNDESKRAKEEKIKENMKLFMASTKQNEKQLREMRLTQYGKSQYTAVGRMQAERQQRLMNFRKDNSKLSPDALRQKAKVMEKELESMESRKMARRVSRRLSKRSVLGKGSARRTRGNSYIPKSSFNRNLGRSAKNERSLKDEVDMEEDISGFGFEKDDEEAIEILEELEIEEDAPVQELRTAVLLKRRMSRSHWDDSDSDEDEFDLGFNPPPLEHRKSIAMLTQAASQVIAVQKKRAQSVMNNGNVNHLQEISGYGTKLALNRNILQQRPWRRRFLVFNPKNRTVTYYTKAFMSEREKSKFIKGKFTMNHATSERPGKVKLHMDKVCGRMGPGGVLELINGAGNNHDLRVDKSLFLYFDSKEDLIKWYNAVQEMIESWDIKEQNKGSSANQYSVVSKPVGVSVANDRLSTPGSENDLFREVMQRRTMQNRRRRGKGKKGRQGGARAVKRDVRLDLKPAHLSQNTLDSCDKLAKDLCGKDAPKKLVKEMYDFMVELMLMLDQGSLSSEDAKQLLAERAKTMDNKHRKRSTEFGLQLACRNCGTLNNTSLGTTCQGCGNELVSNCAHCGRVVKGTPVIGALDEKYCSDQCLTSKL